MGGRGGSVGGGGGGGGVGGGDGGGDGGGGAGGDGGGDGGDGGGDGGDGGAGGDGGGDGVAPCTQITNPPCVADQSLLHTIVSPAAITTPSGPVLPQYLVPPTVRES